MQEIRFTNKNKYADAIDLLIKIGGMFHGVPSDKKTESVLIVSDAQYDELLRNKVIELNKKGADVNGQKTSSQKD